MRTLTISLALAATAGTLPLAQTKSVRDGVFTAEQAKRGAVLYSGNCASCHGADLAGLDQAPALSGGAFTANWDGVTAADLFDRIRISMPANKPGSLSRPQNADIVAFVLSANGYPSGATELASTAADLKIIKIEPPAQK
jgi:S-disulfanyl-L-cysteine oxidoreductase SoxD